MIARRPVQTRRRRSVGAFAAGTLVLGVGGAAVLGVAGAGNRASIGPTPGAQVTGEVVALDRVTLADEPLLTPTDLGPLQLVRAVEGSGAVSRAEDHVAGDPELGAEIDEALTPEPDDALEPTWVGIGDPTALSCERLAQYAIDADPGGAALVEIRQVRIHEDLRASSAGDATPRLVLTCRGSGVWADGFEGELWMDLTVEGEDRLTLWSAVD